MQIAFEIFLNSESNIRDRLIVKPNIKKTKYNKTFLDTIFCIQRFTNYYK